MVKGIGPAFYSSLHKGARQSRVFIKGLFRGVDAILREIQPVVTEEKRGQFIRIEPCVENRMVLVVPHGRSNVDPISQKEIYGEGLGDDLYMKIVLLEKGPGLNLKIFTPEAHLLAV